MNDIAAPEQSKTLVMLVVFITKLCPVELSLSESESILLRLQKVGRCQSESCNKSLSGAYVGS